jgi:hypothetical protein
MHLVNFLAPAEITGEIRSSEFEPPRDHSRTADDKASTLALFRSGKLRYAQLDYENTRVRLFGETAVITGDAHVKAQTEEHALA